MALQMAGTAQSTAASSSQQQHENFTKTVLAVTNPVLFNDERDQIIAKFNQLLAFAGYGKGYFYSGAPPVDFAADNPFCRFKAVSYNRLTGFKNEDGFIGFIIKKNVNDIANVKQSVIDVIYAIMGKQPRFGFKIESIKPLADDRCELVGYVTEEGANGLKRRVPAADAYNFFNTDNSRTQLKQLAVEEIVPKVDLTTEKLEEYLAVPQQGIDRTVWIQAQQDNPDPKIFLPWPILGFSQLRERQLLQQQESVLQQNYLKELANKIERVEQKTLTCQSRLAQLRAAEDFLSHRLLKIVGAVLRRSRQGHALDANEELLQSQLESVFIRLNGPLQIKGRLSEILSQFRCRSDAILQMTNFRAQGELATRYVDETKSHLKKYQDGLEKLVDVVQSDLEDLDVVEDAMKPKQTSSTLRK